MADRRLANLAGYTSVTLWSFSALFISWTSDMPPFLLAALNSAIGFAFFGLKWLTVPKQLQKALRQPKQVWALYFLAVVFYRGFYLSGLKLAPIVEANLLNYLWPLLIIVLSALLDKKKIPPPIYVGAVACFTGVICIGLSNKGGTGLSFEHGHIFALVAASSWALYSVLTRRFPGAITDMIGVMHLIAVAVFSLFHIFFEAPVSLASISPLAWIGTTGLSLAVSLGYSLWDRAMTHGDRERVATAAYFTPLMSTVWLILFAQAPMTKLIWIAAVLILGGSLISRFWTSDKKLQRVAEGD
jgi:drug/metabolite transporter (DMT)-like permease